MTRTDTRQNPVRLGVSPLSWVNEVLEDFGAGATAEQVLKEAASAGYQGVELSKVFPRDSKTLAALLQRRGLSLISGWHSGFLADRSVAEELKAVRPHAELLNDNGASVMVYGECGRMPVQALDIPMSRRGKLGGEEWHRYGERLTEFAHALQREHGLGLSYHFHLMMVAETVDEVRSVMNGTGPAVGLLLDTGHAFAGGFDYATLIGEFAPRINHIHLKDVRRPMLADVHVRDLSFNDAVRGGMFTVPGDGDVDFSALRQFLATRQYAGWLVVEAEQNPKTAPPLATVERAKEFVIKKILNI